MIILPSTHIIASFFVNNHIH